MSSSLSLILFLFLISILPLSHSSDLQTHLITLRSQSQSSLIHLNDALLNRILSSPTPRPFSLLIFFDAINLHSKPDLKLKSLLSEFSLVSKSYLSNNQNPNPDIFFFDIEFKESQASFSKFEVNSLPHILLVPNNADAKNLNTIKMDAADYSRLAESMAEFVEKNTKVKIGEIRRPPIVSRTQMGVIFAGFLISLPFVVKRLYLGDTLLHDKRVWLIGSVFVYFFSVSGGMFNIIRKMPMFMGDRENPDKVVFFYQGSGMQLGAEGFSVGGLYSVVGLLLAFVTHFVVRVRNVGVQRGIMVVALFVSFWAVKKVVFLDNWKTGYGIHMYWPSGWQ